MGWCILAVHYSFFFLPFLLGPSFLQARNPGKSIFVSSKREDKMRKFRGAREESVRILLMINLRSRRS